MHDALYAQRGRLGLDDVLRAAARPAWTPSACAPTSRRASTRSGWSATWRARRAGEVTGTPGFFANGVRVEGSFDAQSLMAALERAG